MAQGPQREREGHPQETHPQGEGATQPVPSRRWGLPVRPGRGWGAPAAVSERHTPAPRAPAPRLRPVHGPGDQPQVRCWCALPAHKHAVGCSLVRRKHWRRGKGPVPWVVNHQNGCGVSATVWEPSRYLLMLDPDSLLWSFRRTAGLPSPGKPYTGWESPESELRGHFVGHFLSATALAWASTGNTSVKVRGGRRWCTCRRFLALAEARL